MSSYNVNGVIEFVSIQGDLGGIDALINAWSRFHRDATIIDIKYQAVTYPDRGNKDKLVKSALVLFHKGGSATDRIQEKQEPGARTMVMNMRKDMATVDDTDVNP